VETLPPLEPSRPVETGDVRAPFGAAAVRVGGTSESPSTTNTASLVVPDVLRPLPVDRFHKLFLGGGERCLRAAWFALTEKRYDVAITAADECIDRYGARAADQQAMLAAAKAPQPDTRNAADASVKKEVLLRQALNDVAVAFWVKAEAAAALGQGKGSRCLDAKAAYEGALRLTYARCYDDSGDSFWDPSSEAAARLSRLKCS
jgi:hypothetical protein